MQLNVRTNEAGILTRASPLESPSNNPFRKKRSVLHWKEELVERRPPEFDTPRQSKRNKPPPLPPEIPSRQCLAFYLGIHNRPSHAVLLIL